MMHSMAISTTMLVDAAIAVLLSCAFLRLLYILPTTNKCRPQKRMRGDYTRLLIVLGSGGHTAEMLAILRNLDCSLYTHRTYVVSAGDNFSATKAQHFELWLDTRAKNAKDSGKLYRSGAAAYDIRVIPRARKIHQSLLTTPISALQSLVASIEVLKRPDGSSKDAYPDLIITNGPGTAVCVVLAALLLKYFNIGNSHGAMRTIYVESWARVTSLSLSGKILSRLVDRFLVQWERLSGASGRAEYRGVLV